METTIMGSIGYRIWGIWGSCYKILKSYSIYLRGSIGFGGFELWVKVYRVWGLMLRV